MTRDDEDELGYLRQIELLAMQVAGNAFDEEFMAPGAGEGGPDLLAMSPFQRAVYEMVRKVRWWHFPEDGCIKEPDRSLMTLGGVLLIGPDIMPERWNTDYAALCKKFGVPARDEGWALWCTWDKRGRAYTLVTSNLKTTRGILNNWSRGRDIHPLRPEQGQVAATIRGWHGPIIVSPGRAAQLELVDRTALNAANEPPEDNPQSTQN